MDNQDPDSDATEGAYEHSEELRRSILQRAEEIAGRMDNVLSSSPYEDDPILRKLEGMVALWVGDLSVVQLPEGMAPNGMTDEQDSSRPDSLQGNEADLCQEYMISVGVRSEHVKRAKKALERAKTLERKKAAPDEAG